MNGTKGFTLPELLIVLAITSVLGAIVVTGYKGLQNSGDATHAGFIYSDALREAQMRALGMEFDTTWGTAIVGKSVVVFSGTSYATRTATRDHTYVLPSSVTATGATSTIFNKFSGVPTSAATTTFANLYASSTISVTSGGAIGYTL